MISIKEKPRYSFAYIINIYSRRESVLAEENRNKINNKTNSYSGHGENKNNTKPTDI